MYARVMLEGHVDHISRHIVQGWALDTANVSESINVSIVLNGTPISRVTANLPRPDLAAVKKMSSALHGFRAALPAFLDSTQAHHVEIRFAKTGKLIPNGEHIFPSLEGYDASPPLLLSRRTALTPLLLTHLPRSGSTMCMALLNRHPSIVVAERYPFEVKPATYYALAARSITARGDHEHSASPTEFMRTPMQLGFNPFNHWSFDAVFKDAQLRDHFFERESKTALFKALRSVAKDYYHHLAADQNKSSARLFAEKCEVHGSTRQSLLTLFPGAREILLIRDPRDILCSSVSYFKRSLDDDLLHNLRNGCETLRQIAMAHNRKPIVVKYESLVFDQVATLKGIAKLLGIAEDAWPSTPIVDSQIFKEHATTGSPQESVGRWKSDLSEAQKELCARTFSSYLAEFQYDAPK